MLIRLTTVYCLHTLLLLDNVSARFLRHDKRGPFYRIQHSERPSLDILDGRIVGGRRCRPGEAPYQLSLLRKRQHICGATLIKSPFSPHIQIGITAAHCVCKKGTNIAEDPSGYSVRGGSTSRFAGQTVYIKRFKVHENYAGTHFHDIALIFFDGKFTLGNNLKPIDLPNADIQPYSLTVTGWGKDNEKGRAQTDLKITTVHVIDNAECSRLYKEHYPDKHVIGETSICALDEGTDACQGDSGGPAVAIDPNQRKVLVGVVSWGKGCARRNTPGVYLRVSSYINWIAENAKSG